ncbi:1-acyl-sn-glycerol-3-phosphate acyltransferase [Massilia glaciei]|uniref:1-acyl-sn-glycerol-3-phosphate acyltransferase n=2 Tax=Massilia glaciei TaxID=1524097 RepID=A0A2U2HF63_9BURK|nr:1-acyl-sn-glycerol-3-phosphate acyltransferase [Massilia glaciei]
MAACALLFPWAAPARRGRYVQRWSRQLLGLCRVTLAPAAGAPALTGTLVVANHVSWLDIFVINALHPSQFVAKSEIRGWPALGWLAARAGTIFIARGSRRELRQIFKALVAALESGERVALFPEGTTAAQGALLPFHANLFEAAIDAGVPVQPVALRYLDAGGAPHPAVEYLGEMTFAQSLDAILSAGAIHAQLTRLPAIESGGAHRRELALATRGAIARALGQAE